MTKFPFYPETDTKHSGIACLHSISLFYGKNHLISDLKKILKERKGNQTLYDLSEISEKIGLRSRLTKVTFDQLCKLKFCQFVLQKQNTASIIIYKLTRNFIFVSDPATGLVKFKKNEFLNNIIVNSKGEIEILLLYPTPRLKGNINYKGFKFLLSYLTSFNLFYFQLILSLLVGSVLQLAFPFLTQSIVDVGINNNDLNFIYVILLAQLVFFFSRSIADLLRSYIITHISSSVNISLVTDFFTKLMKLPMEYFDSKRAGEIFQRIGDNQRVEQFLTGNSLRTLFSMLNLVVFSIVLAFYSLKIFTTYLIGSAFYFIWVRYFLNKKKELDNLIYKQSSKNQGKVIELIYGMQEIKMNNIERKKRWEWETLQMKLYKINLANLSLTIKQNSGAGLLNELKNIIITFLSAKLVLDGQITLGMMLSISYINGQLNAPIMDLVNFMQQWQNAKISIDRLAEIYTMKDEIPIVKPNSNISDYETGIELRNVTFSYQGSGHIPILSDISFSFPMKKVTAIVGASGCGKTTLLKLLLGYYAPNHGEILYKCDRSEKFDIESWREECGTVMQDGFIFSDTIANNISLGKEIVGQSEIERAAKIANIHEFIETLPSKYETEIGIEGVGLSVGQRQRILIARAVCKDPQWLFFDEATSALDSTNEKTIINNLNSIFSNKTVVMVAHRLSTIVNADLIIVLDQGKIVESGNHKELRDKKGYYYRLVLNQLELSK